MNRGPDRTASGARGWTGAGALAALLLAACGSPSAGTDAPPLPECEWCGAAEAPARLSWETTIAGPGEPGERLVLSGTVYRAHGRTPAPGVLLYVYHTNAAGVYPKRGDETGNGRRHGYLRSWLRTDARGRYRIRTIRPGAYPGGTEPAHVHTTVTERGKAETYIDDFVFEGDPRLTPTFRARLKGRGGSGVVRLARGPDGAWTGSRDIRLPAGPP